MKKLPPKGMVLIGLGPLIPYILAVFVSAQESFVKGDIADGIGWLSLSFPVWMIVCLLIPRYRVNCIWYGNGKIIIKRELKNIVNGRLVGKWEVKEDEFLLEEIEIYGLSEQVLHHHVEYHRSNIVVHCVELSRECFFQLKDGRMISYESLYYTRKEELKLIRYVHDEAGIEFQGKLRKAVDY